MKTTDVITQDEGYLDSPIGVFDSPVGGGSSNIEGGGGGISWGHGDGITQSSTETI